MLEWRALPNLSQREGGAACNLAVDDVRAIRADSERPGTQIVYVLAALFDHG